MAASIDQLRRAQANNIVVGTLNTIHPRKEIDKFVLDVDTCNLFLIALTELQDQRLEEDPWSWFGISAIRGLPYQAWQRINQQSAIDAGQYPAWDSDDLDPRLWQGASHRDGDPERGYCPTSSVLFAPWHRPYLAMMEQAIFLKMLDIANRYESVNDRKRYENAAKIFRLPYFDPFAARVLLEPDMKRPLKWQCGIPQILSSHEVRVCRPEDPKFYNPIPNPLYSYQFAITKQGNPPVSTPKYAFDDTPPFHWTRLWFDNNVPIPTGNAVTPNVRTARSPNGWDGMSNHSRLQSHFELSMMGAGMRLYRTLADPIVKYEQFAYTQYWRSRTDAEPDGGPKPNPSNEAWYGSIEDFSNAVHSWLGAAERTGEVHTETRRLPGGGEIRYTTRGQYPPCGHMRKQEYSSFDPIYWLHYW